MVAAYSLQLLLHLNEMNVGILTPELRVDAKSGIY